MWPSGHPSPATHHRRRTTLLRRTIPPSSDLGFSAYRSRPLCISFEIYPSISLSALRINSKGEMCDTHPKTIGQRKVAHLCTSLFQFKKPPSSAIALHNTTAIIKIQKCTSKYAIGNLIVHSKTSSLFEKCTSNQQMHRYYNHSFYV